MRPACCDCWEPTIESPCAPNGNDSCPESHQCCSDDPTTLDGRLPDYGRGLPDVSDPIFAAGGNFRGSSGVCVNTDEVPSGLSLDAPLRCPLPCNPTWPDTDIEAVCGEGAACCQTVSISAEDCVLDPTSGRWRPAAGQDALASLSGGDLWKPTTNSSHQDPDFDACAELADADRTSAIFSDCVGQLSVANQRGFCMQLEGGECPLPADPSTRCDELNS